eukprot:m.51973 g.51973  ORF g.51973 m.51973 type:complete len:79 (+) comp21526_c0_seq1:1345-1581(+)
MKNNLKMNGTMEAKKTSLVFFVISTNVRVVVCCSFSTFCTSFLYFLFIFSDFKTNHVYYRGTPSYFDVVRQQTSQVAR